MTKSSLAVAIEALSWMSYAGLSERAALFKSAKQLGISEGIDLRQAYRLIIETTRYQNRIEWILEGLTPSRSARNLPHGITSLLKILVYLSYVANEREGTLKRHASWGREILGWKEVQPYETTIGSIASKMPPEESPRGENDRLALETCHPAWYVRRLTDTFGRTIALNMLRRNLKPLPSYARLNPLKSREHPAGLLDASKVSGINDVWKLQSSSGFFGSDLASSGLMVVQDLASIVAGLVACPRPGDEVLDVCSAPGNKTSHLAAIMNNEGRILSVDLSAARLRRWKEEMARTGCRIALPVRADGRFIPSGTMVDVAVVDPPCSNTGVFARSPSHKWGTPESKVHELSVKQYAILENSSQNVRPGGTLVYCTCSILPEENELVIENFLRKRPEFRLVKQTPFIGEPGLRGFSNCQRFFSYLHDCNGYFIAKMQKES